MTKSMKQIMRNIKKKIESIYNRVENKEDKEDIEDILIVFEEKLDE